MGAVRNHQPMTSPGSFSLLVPAGKPLLARDLRDAIHMRCPRSSTSLGKSTDSFCRIEVATASPGREAWWRIRQVISEVERRHEAGGAIEMIA